MPFSNRYQKDYLRLFAFLFFTNYKIAYGMKSRQQPISPLFGRLQILHLEDFISYFATRSFNYHYVLFFPAYQSAGDRGINRN